MKLTYLGVKRIQGYKKSDGEPFDMCTLFVSVPIQKGVFGKTDRKTHITGHGCEPAEMQCDAACVSQFETLPSGVDVELLTEQRFFMGEFKTMIVGVKRPAVVGKVA